VTFSLSLFEKRKRKAKKSQQQKTKRDFHLLERN
jgi:hypothetical protein